MYRPAAVDQLLTLANQVGVGAYADPGTGSSGADRPSDRPTVRQSDVVGLVRRGIEAANKARARTVLVDTAGRLQIDEEMMSELRRLKEAVKPHEILLVADGMTGQDAVRIAQGFHAQQLPRGIAPALEVGINSYLPHVQWDGRPGHVF